MNSSMQTIVKRLPLMAAIMGAGLAMATTMSTPPSNNAKEDMYAFEYTPSTSSVSQVQNRENWTYTPNQELCDDVDNRPCKILVTHASIDSGASGIVLSPSFSISAAASSGGAYVSGISDVGGTVSNRN